MSLLSGFDLIRLETKLKREVNDFFKWEKFGDCDVEPDWRVWNKMMGTGKIVKQFQQENVWILKEGWKIIFMLEVRMVWVWVKVSWEVNL